MEMKDRIAHIIRAKNLTAAEFALRLGIQPSNISHLLSGRNNPSLDFVKKLKETFPEYNLDWIVFGRGPMTVSEPFVELSTAGQATAKDKQIELDTLPDEAIFDLKNEVDLPINQLDSSKESVLKKIILVYSDNTFELIFPR